MYPNSIKNIIEVFKSLPGIGEKTAERLAFALINFDKDRLTDFSNAIISVRDNLKYCSICGNITENDKCNICNDSERNNKIIFVVEKPKDISLFEKINSYNGKYHVLGNLISPLDGIGPEDVNIDNLIKRIDSDSVEGDTIVDKGTDVGGAIEVYKSVKDAEARCEYLSGFDNTLLYSGSYAIIGTMVIRTSYRLDGESQLELTTEITKAFTKL